MEFIKRARSIDSKDIDNKDVELIFATGQPWRKITGQ